MHIKGNGVCEVAENAFGKWVLCVHKPGDFYAFPLVFKFNS